MHGAERFYYCQANCYQCVRIFQSEAIRFFLQSTPKSECSSRILNPGMRGDSDRLTLHLDVLVDSGRLATDRISPPDPGASGPTESTQRKQDPSSMRNPNSLIAGILQEDYRVDCRHKRARDRGGRWKEGKEMMKNDSESFQ